MDKNEIKMTQFYLDIKHLAYLEEMGTGIYQVVRCIATGPG